MYCLYFQHYDVCFQRNDRSNGAKGHLNPYAKVHRYMSLDLRLCVCWESSQLTGSISKAWYYVLSRPQCAMMNAESGKREIDRGEEGRHKNSPGLHQESEEAYLLTHHRLNRDAWWDRLFHWIIWHTIANNIAYYARGGATGWKIIIFFRDFLERNVLLVELNGLWIFRQKWAIFIISMGTQFIK